MASPAQSCLLAGVLAASLSCSRPRADAELEGRAEAPAPTEPVRARLEAPAPSPAEQARRLSQRLIIVDGHVDVPYRLSASSDGARITEDISRATAAGDFDAPRARRGGLDAPFMSIYVPVRYQATGGARALADTLIDMIEGVAREHPAELALARTPEEVRASSAAGKISLPLGIENGAALEGRLENIAHFRARGVSYITLTHSRDNDIGDSSSSELHTHGGLSPFGKRVIAEMNRVGVMIDVSHVSDETFSQAVELSQVPVIASHSSLRHFVPGLRRNVSDAMLEALARRGGVIMLNFGSGFLSPEASAVSLKRWQAAARFAAQHGLDRDKAEDRKRIDAHLAASLPVPRAHVSDVADQIDHVKRLVGIDHVGLGSDFEGVGDSLPVGLEDVSKYPNLLRVLIERGYTERELEQLCSGNILRVWQRTLDHARAAHAPSSATTPPTAR